MKFERHPERHEHIGTGGYKRAYKVETVDGVPEVHLVMKHEYSNEQMKGLFYLNKIATAMFPGKIARVKQAGNFDDEEGKSSQFVAEYHEPDAQHVSMQHHAKALDGQYWADTDDEQEVAEEFSRLSTERSRLTRRHPGIQQFRDSYEEAGFVNKNPAMHIGWGSQDVILDEKGNFVYVDIDIPWDEPESVGEDTYTNKCLRFDPSTLQAAIMSLPIETRNQAQVYFDRLIQLCREAGFEV